MIPFMNALHPGAGGTCPMLGDTCPGSLNTPAARIHQAPRARRTWMDELLPIFEPCIEIRESPEAYLVQADLPGLPLECVEVRLHGDRLVISGEREPDPATPEERIHVTRGCRYGTFAFTFPLPRGVDARNASASLRDGVLAVRLPKLRRDRVREVPISCAALSAAGDDPRSTPRPGPGSCRRNPVRPRPGPS